MAALNEKTTGGNGVGGKLSLRERMKKGMDKFGKQTSKAIVKGKIMAIQKIAHAEATPEVPEITGALERLKATKNEISQLADVARYLYEARINQANYQIEMSHQLRDCRAADNDGWSKLAVAMGMSMSRLESIHSEHCEKMKEDFVAPIEKFRDVDVNEVQKLKLRYKEAKSAYDVAIAKEKAAKESGQAPKMQQAYGKKQETESTLKTMREQFVKSVEALERQKNTELLGLVLDYWQKYLSFAKAQHTALQANPIPSDIDPTNYKPPMFATLTPGSTTEEHDPTFGGPEFVTNYNEQPQHDEQKNNNNIAMGAAAAAGIAVVGGAAVGAAVISNPTDVNNGGYDDGQQQQGGYEQGGYEQNGGYNENQGYDENQGYGDGANGGYDENQTGYDENQGGYDENQGGYDDGTGHQEEQYDEQQYDENGQEQGYDENGGGGYDENQGGYDENGGGYDDGQQEQGGYDNQPAGVDGAGLSANNPFGQGAGAGGGDPLDFDPYQQ